MEAGNRSFDERIPEEINRRLISQIATLHFAPTKDSLTNLTKSNIKENVFNVGEAYKSMYNLTKKNGFIWIFQSVFGGNGFFNFDASFFTCGLKFY